MKYLCRNTRFRYFDSFKWRLKEKVSSKLLYKFDLDGSYYKDRQLLFRGIESRIRLAMDFPKPRREIEKGKLKYLIREPYESNKLRNLLFADNRFKSLRDFREFRNQLANNQTMRFFDKRATEMHKSVYYMH